MDDSTARYDDNVDKLLKSYSSDQSFQWTPPKENLEQKGVSSKGQLPKPNMQCSRCKKLEYVKCESLESTGVIRPFVCAVRIYNKKYASILILPKLYYIAYLKLIF